MSILAGKAFASRAAGSTKGQIMAESTPTRPSSLTQAIIEASTAPLVLLDERLRLVAASASFHRAFGLEPATTTGRCLLEIGGGEWDSPRLRVLLEATLSGAAQIDSYEFDLERAGQGARRIVLNAHRLAYDDPHPVRLLLSATDVTEARLADRIKDDLLREKGILLQEIQHRVANSLQIIAAILLQSARNVSSDETRMHLRDAHQRVMSIAAVQRQLAASGGREVGLRAYFTQLCESLGASMIRDHKQLSVEVTTDDFVVGADVSVSLGLIVTELVINALKHAFPDRRPGKIIVDYSARGSEWTLSVADDGVGMPPADAPATAGLGTIIVESLAKKLRARVRVSEQRPGAKVSVVHMMAEPPRPAAAI